MLDPESNHGHTYQCNSENSEEGFSEDNFECTGTDNADVIWVKVFLLMQMNLITYILKLDEPLKIGIPSTFYNLGTPSSGQRNMPQKCNWDEKYPSLFV